MSYSNRRRSFLGAAVASAPVKAPVKTAPSKTVPAPPAYTTTLPGVTTTSRSLIPADCGVLEGGAAVASRFLMPAALSEGQIVVAAFAGRPGMTTAQLEEIVRRVHSELRPLSGREASAGGTSGKLASYYVLIARSGVVGNVAYIVARVQHIDHANSHGVSVRSLAFRLGTKLQDAARAVTGQNVLAITGVAPSISGLDVELAAVSLASGVENLRATLTTLFQAPTLEVTQIGGNVALLTGKLRAGLEAIDGAEAAVTRAVNEARTAAASQEPIVASGTIDGLVRVLQSGINAIHEGVSQAAASPRASEIQQQFIGQIPNIVREHVQRQISRLDFSDNLRRKWAECKLLQQAEALIPAKQAAATAELPNIQALEARWAGIAPETIQGAINTLNGGIETLRGIQSQLGLEWWQKKFGPLPVWTWGALGGAVLLGGAVYLKKRKTASSTAITKK